LIFHADEADEMFRRAVMTDPCHRENLENYAYFLSQALNNQHEALYYYQVLVVLWGRE
jgi:Tfp pilus assembly protein PilF